mmetsp:Transcript_11963/g.18350  ORF Transcript_11963/g.18350 Transcript_11963/m.18350 type:complete len:105 (+) Transcript_11963:447-761(+)
MSALQQREHLGHRGNYAQKMVNAVHVLVRNSMGSALCLDMALVLPCHCKRMVRDDDGKESATIQSLQWNKQWGANVRFIHQFIYKKEWGVRSTSTALPITLTSS